ncbi:MAG: 16S rRNA (adenine1518-N6/adenine1519-N6)-dimethyltransferase [Myxococcota bacterium]
MGASLSEEIHPRVLLKRLEQRARRRFGQHFLARPGIVTRIVRAARVEPGDRVVEVGPGLGILTRALLAAGAELTAIELDRDMAQFIREEHSEVRLIEGDAMRVNLDDDLPGSGWKVVANLPYNVGTRLVLNWVDMPDRFESLTVMLQKEVVDRILAEPGTRAYGSLTVQMAARSRARMICAVPPAAFYPPPKVDSAVIQLFPHKPELGGVPSEHFDRVVRAAFSQRRKTLRNALSALFDRDVVDAALAETGIDGQIRGEMLDLDAFRAISAQLPE